MKANRIFNDKKIKSYCGKWCLTKKYCDRLYDNIYVIDIKDDVIKYFDPVSKRIEYTDILYYENIEFFVSPYQDPDPTKVKIKNNSDNEPDNTTNKTNGYIPPSGCFHVQTEYYDINPSPVSSEYALKA